MMEESRRREASLARGLRQVQDEWHLHVHRSTQQAAAAAAVWDVRESNEN